MKAKDVVKVFESFEDETEDDELMDLEKVKGVLRSLDDRKDRNLWKTMDGYDEKDYMTFKGSVLEFYLGTKKTATYVLEQLEEFTHDNRDRRMTPQRLSQYQSHFKPIALWLEENDIISTKELDEYFWYGLPKDIRKSIRQDLDMRSKADIPSIKQASKSARHVVQAMIDEDDGDDGPFSFGVVMEPVSSSNDSEELADAPANYDITPENEELASVDIVQAAEEVVFAENGVVWAAGEVLAIDEVGRATDGFVRAVDEDALLDKVMLENEDDVPANPETVPINDETQPIDDEDPAGSEDGVAETRRMWKLDDGVLEDDENVPEYAEFLPHVGNIPVVKEEPPDLQSALAVEDTLGNDDEVLAMNDNVPATHNQFSGPKDMSTSLKYTPDAKPVVLEGLSVPEDLWNLDNGH